MTEAYGIGGKLERGFYTRDVLVVARDILGRVLVRKTEQSTFAGKIVEVEAYDGAVDEAAHSFRGMTERNRVLFGRGGYLYVYFTYGMHFCSNVVTGEEGRGSALLLRAVEPITGISRMAQNRFGASSLPAGKTLYRLTNGPAKLCRAFEIDRKDNGTDLLGDSIFLTEGEPAPDDSIGVSRRIGIRKSTDLPWRFFRKDNPFVSGK